MIQVAKPSAEITARKRILEEEIRVLEEQEALEADTKRRAENYQRFLDRPNDWVIGRAHCETNFQDNGWHHPKGKQVPQFTVRIQGNMGHSYIPTAGVTHATMTYFHNVWTGKQQKEFEQKLDKLVWEEITRIMSQPQQVIELMGLQSDRWHLENDFPEDKEYEIRENVGQAQAEILDRFSDEQLGKTPKLSHGEAILRTYLERHRPEVQQRRKELQEANHSRFSEGEAA